MVSNTDRILRGKREVVNGSIRVDGDAGVLVIMTQCSTIYTAR